MSILFNSMQIPLHELRSPQFLQSAFKICELISFAIIIPRFLTDTHNTPVLSRKVDTFRLKVPCNHLELSNLLPNPYLLL